MLSRLLLLPLTALQATATILPSPQTIFTNDPNSQVRIPTAHESAIQARRILHLSNIGTLSTVFPTDGSSSIDATENRPSGLGGAPIGLMDYYADCENVGNPTILAIKIATTFKNVAAGSNVTMSLRWHPPDMIPRSAANLPRFSLLGHLEDISDFDAVTKGLATCFVRNHPDAVQWLPGNRVHESHFVRMVVDHVYWIGGFGDRAYIGWIPLDDFRSITPAEMDSIRLPGEEEKSAAGGWWSWS